MQEHTTEVTEGGRKDSLKNPGPHGEKINQSPLPSIGVSQPSPPIAHCVVLFKVLAHWVGIVAS